MKQLDLTQDKKSINAQLESLVTSTLEAEFSSIWFYDKHNFALKRQREDSFCNEIDLHQKKGIIYDCFMTKQSKLYNYLASDKNYVPDIDNPDNIKIKSKVMVPLVDGDDFVGIVTAYNSIKNVRKFSKLDVQKLQKLTPTIIEALYVMYNIEK
jgi:transcriptional regulator with GAF, ATPase, and Fis domain